MKAVFLFCVVVILLPARFCNYINPQVFPAKGPFLERWHMRITDFDNLNSLGLQFGRVLKRKGDHHTSHSNPAVVTTVLWRKCAKTNSCKLKALDASFSTSQLRVTVSGKPVSHQPDKTSPAHFAWLVNSGRHGGVFNQTGEKCIFNFRIGNLSLRGELGEHIPWNPDGSGPEGWLQSLPLRLHWFVYSLRSRVTTFELKDLGSRKVILKGHSGFAHFEKHWGRSFPPEWTWSEGVSDKSKISFALSTLTGGGPEELGYLIGYRNPSKHISIDMRPDNSAAKVRQNGCKGQVNITVSSVEFELDINISALTKSFSSCLLNPTTSGFRKAYVGTYDAVAKIKVSKRINFGLLSKSIDEQTLSKVALEFGGKFVCKNKCKTQFKILST